MTRVGHCVLQIHTINDSFGQIKHRAGRAIDDDAWDSTEYLAGAKGRDFALSVTCWGVTSWQMTSFLWLWTETYVGPGLLSMTRPE